LAENAFKVLIQFIWARIITVNSVFMLSFAYETEKYLVQEMVLQKAEKF